MQTQKLIQAIEILPPELQKQVCDFVIFLRKQHRQILKQRTVGEYKDKIIIHNDFDAALPDEFWLEGK